MTATPRLFVAALLLITAPVTHAAWPDDPLVNVPVSRAAGEKYDVFAVTDGAGGAIIAWEDERDGHADIYVQRVSAAGDVLWRLDGEPVCTAAGDQGLYHSSTSTTGVTPLVADGQGGAWIVWQDERAFGSRQRDVYAQHVDAGGQMLLANNGMAVAAGNGMEDQPTACGDGQGGIIVAWQDKNADPIFADVHAQRLDAGGRLVWNDGNSVPVVVWDWDQGGVSICADGNGGAVIAWNDSRDDVGDVYAQRLDPAGTALWTVNGVAVCVRAGDQDAITVRPASDGDPLLAWVDRRTGSPDIRGQKLALADGASRWTPGGVPICTAQESQYRPALCSDGDQGAIVAWYDFRNAPSGPPWNLDIYAQRLDASGAAVWPINGVSVCGAPDAQRDADLVADGLGGAYLAWEDNRLGTGREDIYAQHINPVGQSSWDLDGVAVCTAPGNQNRPDVIAGADGMIAAWTDDRDVLYENDVYCDRVADHPLAAPLIAPDALRVTVIGDPEQGRSVVSFTLAGDARVSVEVYDVRGRRVRVLARGDARGAGRQEFTWAHRDATGRPVQSGVYLVKVAAGGEAAVGRALVLR